MRDLAAAAAWQRHLVSFTKIGLVEQDGSKHALGPLALQLGLISLQQVDPLRLATPRIEALALEIGHTEAIAVWGNRGRRLSGSLRRQARCASACGMAR